MYLIMLNLSNNVKIKEILIFLRQRKNLWIVGLIGLVSMGVLGLLAIVGVYFYITPSLPAVESLREVQFQVPLRIYTRDEKLIAEFGEKRRSPATLEEVPDLMVKAFLAAEDDRFYEHPGVDYQGILRAVFLLLKTGEKAQGGSTITMQVARNFFLSREKTYLRKISEIFLALKIEDEISKNEILELYLNKIYLGQRAYGVRSAAEGYYGVDLDQLSLAQIAMIAGLPKAPSTFNPIVNPGRATERRNYVLRRMRDLEFIDEQMFDAAVAETVTASRHGYIIEVDAPYVADIVRKEIVETHGEAAYTSGMRVYTTMESRLQTTANESLYQALHAYTKRHGYKGPEATVTLPENPHVETWLKALETHGRPQVGPLSLALVVGAEGNHAAVFLPDKRIVPIGWDGLKWAREYIDENAMGPVLKSAEEALKPGDLVRVYADAAGRWHLSQVPEVQGALVSLNPKNGAVLAMVGGYDFKASHFNRVTQADRQPGSSFKPFVYSAALENGFTTASLINDAPVVFDDPGLEAEWRPENYSGKFYGPTRLRQGLIKSRNLISIRLLKDVGIRTALKHVKAFGIDTSRLPKDLSLALGSGVIKPMELAKGYTVIANGGYPVQPYMLERVMSQEGEVLYQAEPKEVCRRCEEYVTRMEETYPEFEVEAELAGEFGPPPLAVPANQAERSISSQNIYLTTSMMRDVIRFGTGQRALQLGRTDLAGKTGTTNDQLDAWFSGFSPDVVTTAWVGFDDPRPLGAKESGARAALPMWIQFMREALRNKREREFVQPPGLVTVRIDPETGLLASAGDPDAMFETFRADNVPQQEAESVMAVDHEQAPDQGVGGGNISEQLF